MEVSNVNAARAFVFLATWVEQVVCRDENDVHVNVANF